MAGGRCTRHFRIPKAVWPSSLASILALGTAEGLAAEWHVTPSFEVDESYNDNVNLVNDGQHKLGDFITTFSPGALITGTGRRLQLSAIYDPQYLIFAEGSSGNQLRQQFQGTANTELVEDSVFLKANGSVNQQFVNNAAPITTTTLTASNNVQTVQIYQLGPEFRHHLGQYVDTDATTQYTTTRTSGNTVAPTDALASTFIATNGPYFGPFGWTLTAEDSRTYTGTLPAGTPNVSTVLGQPGTANTTTIDQLGRADVTYAIRDRLSALGGLGYERIKDSTLTSTPSHGVIWDIGGKYAPNSRLNLSLTYGHRFGGTDWEGDATYTFLAGSTIKATYTESLQTSASQLGSQLNNIGIGSTGAPVNTQTGQPLAVGNSALSLTNGAFIDKRFDVVGSLPRGRDTFSIDAFDEKQNFQSQNIQQDVKGGTFSWVRQLRPAVTSTFTINFTRTDFGNGTGRIDNQYLATLAFTYQMSNYLDSALSFSRTQRLSNTIGQGVRNDIVLLTLRAHM